MTGETVPDIHVIYWNLGAWAFATVLAAIFLLGDLLGPYKVSRTDEWPPRLLCPPSWRSVLTPQGSTGAATP